MQRESKVALIIIYNHQYNKNIDIVEQIYKNRFSNIYHLVPFYNGDKSNVIPIFESSHYFQGYVAQGFKSFFKENYDHYFFIGDDLIINPIINETNYDSVLKLTRNTSFIPRLSTIDEGRGFWANTICAYQYNIKSPGVEAKNQLPSYQEALELLKHFGLENKPLKFDQIWAVPQSLKKWRIKIILDSNFVIRYIKNKITKKRFSLLYPLVRSYSDIFVISSDCVKKFQHYCGIFAATKLFVELAIPTSLVFSAKNIVTEKELDLKGQALWTTKDFEILDQYDNELQNLLNNFPKGFLYLHPVKLSKWKTKI